MDRKQLIHYWRVEVMDGADKPIKIKRLLRRLRRKQDYHYLFWFRLAQFLHRKERGFLNYPKIARNIHARLLRLHNIDIMLGAEIGPGLTFGHRVGVVIAEHARIGENLFIRQNTTIGIKAHKQNGLIYLGDNVDIGANSCIIGDDLKIGSNVVIGAMSFVNKDIPDNSVFYSTHTPNIK